MLLLLLNITCKVANPCRKVIPGHALFLVVSSLFVCLLLLFFNCMVVNHGRAPIQPTPLGSVLESSAVVTSIVVEYFAVVSRGYSCKESRLSSIIFFFSANLEVTLS